MARILISDSDMDARRRLAQMVTQLGHEPVAVKVPAPGHLTSGEVLIVEPTTPVGAVLAQAASIATPWLPLICASVSEPPAELAELGVIFEVSLLKPFSLEQLSEAIERASRERDRRRYLGRRPDDRAA